MTIDREVEFDVLDFEQLRQRHGWSHRVDRATRCFCFNEQSGAPDYKCEVCKGLGWIYNLLDVKKVYEVPGSYQSANTYSVAPYSPINIERAYNANTKEVLSVLSITGSTVVVNGSAVPAQDHNVVFDLIVPIENTVTNERAVRLPHKTLKVNNPSIRAVLQVRNATTNEIYAVRGFTDDKIFYNGTEPAATDSILVNYSYVPLNVSIISSVSYKTLKGAVGEFVDGDLILTFSNEILIGQNYKVVPYYAEAIATDLLIKTGDLLELRYNNAVKIIEVSVDGSRLSFNDYALTGDKQVAILTPIADNKQVSVTYTYRPEYVVQKELPQIRHQEDKALLRRVLLRKFEVVSKVMQKTNPGVTQV